MSSAASVGHNESVSVHPQSVHIGAEIHGVDLSQPLADATVAEINAALLKWKVVFFRDQQLDHDSHVRFARAFGEPTPGHVVLGDEGTHPEIYSIAKYRAATEGPPGVKRSWTGWHTDITAALNPPAISVLRAEAIPSVGGDTCWSNMAAAHTALSPPMQAFAEGLRAVHYPATTWPGPHARGRPSEARPGEQAIDMVTEHPLVT
jgi:alpha-ketoglutarate-dependent taurine dioxygenase